MLLAIVDFSTPATDRAAALDLFHKESESVRAMPGNVDFRVLTSREDDGRTTILHEWADEESFAGYLRSESFARFSAMVGPKVSAPPVSRRFHAELLETVA